MHVGRQLTGVHKPFWHRNIKASGMSEWSIVTKCIVSMGDRMCYGVCRIQINDSTKAHVVYGQGFTRPGSKLCTITFGSQPVRSLPTDRHKAIQDKKAK